jgi:hypothetical protein
MSRGALEVRAENSELGTVLECVAYGVTPIPIYLEQCPIPL